MRRPYDGTMDTPKRGSSRLADIARRAMTERDLEPDFSPAALAELKALKPAAAQGERDLRALAWCSIDNDDSLDLDQLSVAGDPHDGLTPVLVAIADVDAL